MEQEGNIQVTHHSLGEALVVKSIVSYLEKNPQVVRFQDEHCRELSK